MLISLPTRLAAAVSAYVRNPLPREANANTIALVIVSNQPFYPLYIHWIAPAAMWASCVVFLSTPFFAAVPAAMRRSSLLGRSLLVGTGLADTILCRIALGTGSGVEAFLFPCIFLAVFLFSSRERAYSACFLALAIGVYWVPVDHIAPSLHSFSPQDDSALQRLNFLSAACLTALIAWLFGPRSEAMP